jgi:hypothetical protein
MKTIEEKTQKLPTWFNGTIYEEGAVVENPFTGVECELNNIELSMYDFVMGCTMVMEQLGAWNPKTAGLQKQMADGLHWFRVHNAKAYMDLLD